MSRMVAEMVLSGSGDLFNSNVGPRAARKIPSASRQARADILQVDIPC